MVKNILIGAGIGLGAALIAALIAFLIVRHRKSAQRQEFKDKLAGLSGIIVQALGGLNNIKSVESRMSRLSIVVNDSSLINLDDLKNNGLNEVIVMEKKIVIVVGDESKTIANDISNLLEVKKD